MIMELDNKEQLLLLIEFQRRALTKLGVTATDIDEIAAQCNEISKTLAVVEELETENSRLECMAQEGVESLERERSVIAGLREDLRIEKEISSWNYNLAKANSDLNATILQLYKDMELAKAALFDKDRALAKFLTYHISEPHIADIAKNALNIQIAQRL